MENSKYSVVSLFSGAGGFDWGFHRTGWFQTLLACEKLPEPAATLAHNLNLEIVIAENSISPVINGTPFVIQGLIENVDFSQANFEPDVLIGGPPCQDFSITISKPGGGRPGLNGGRGQLYIEFVRAVMFLQPKIFVFENVPGLISANNGAAYDTILNDLQNLEKRRLEDIETGNKHKVPSQSTKDYDIVFRDIVDAVKVGVPQTRRRLIIIGIRRDLHNLFDLWEQQMIHERLETALSGESAWLARFPLTCLEVFEGKALPDLHQKYKEVMSAFEEIAYRPDIPKAAEWRKRIWEKLQLDNIQHDYFLANQIEETPGNLADYERAMEEHRQILAELGWLNNPVYEKEFPDRTHLIPHLSNSVIERMRMIPPDENYEFVDETPWKVKGQEISFIYRRPSPLKPAWTVMAYGGGGTYGYHYERERAQLTLRERARIQTFSDDFLFEKDHVRAQIGEAVPPLLGQRIAENIMSILMAIYQHI